jgi:hypothetical protein
VNGEACAAYPRRKSAGIARTIEKEIEQRKIDGIAAGNPRGSRIERLIPGFGHPGPAAESAVHLRKELTVHDVIGIKNAKGVVMLG